MKRYDHQSIEAKWQKKWEDTHAFATPEATSQEKMFILDMFPYPSGYGLHVGHLIGYTGTDVLSRHARMQGKAVLHPMGWDAFGLPAENFAIKTGVHPALSTPKNAATFKQQMCQVGFSYDWSREINTSEPEYYKWTQWLFTLLYKRGLAYRKEGMVNWCESCQTVLANEQVIAGRCERCNTEVVQRNLNQWYFRITEYADRLLADLDRLDWPEKIKTMQRNWIGRSEGARISFTVSNTEHSIEVFTTRPDTLFGATYLVLAPEHPLVNQLTTPERTSEVLAYQERTKRKTELERLHLDKEKTGVWTGAFAIHPLTKQEIPIWISDYVLSTYGTGAIMAVPAHDERDFEFAQKFDLPIKQVIAPSLIQNVEPGQYKPDQPTINGESVIVFVKHPTEEKYLGLDWAGSAWAAKTLLTGTVEDSSPEETVTREIAEETGYTNLASVEKLGVIDGLFYHLPKQTNKLVRGHIYLVKLADTTQIAVADHEATRHTMTWLTKEELTLFLTPLTHQFALRWLNGYRPYTEHGSLVNSGAFDGKTSGEAAAEIVAQAGGSMETTFRLRDWLVSRQRFWGAPIPIMYDDSGAEHVVPEEMLPVELPMNVEFKPTGQSPLVSASDWKRVTLDGKTYTREVDTLDTFVCSSWYYLRYPTPNLKSSAFDKAAVSQWLPVDLYVGGAEHAVLHLLYARFITKVLFDEGLVPFSEPFASLKNQGMILGPDNQKMSKSKGNVITQESVIEEHGADALRMYELFMAPFELEKPWSVRGIVGVRRFLEKVIKLQEKASAEHAADERELRAINQLVAKVSEDIPECKFNTAVAAMMEGVNTLSELQAISVTTFTTLVLTLSPFAPHLAEELWEELGNTTLIAHASWPSVDSTYLGATTVTYAIQVNGKVRAQLELSADITDSTTITERVLALPELSKYLNGLSPKKVIIVPGRLVSLVV